MMDSDHSLYIMSAWQKSWLDFGNLDLIFKVGYKDQKSAFSWLWNQWVDFDQAYNFWEEAKCWLHFGDLDHSLQGHSGT